MSIYVRYMHVCDFCSAKIRDQEFLFAQAPDMELPRPHPNNFRMEGINWDMCQQCMVAVRDAVKGRIDELRGQERLSSYRHPAEIRGAEIKAAMSDRFAEAESTLKEKK
jgi:hypothetical protein